MSSIFAVLLSLNFIFTDISQTQPNMTAEEIEYPENTHAKAKRLMVDAFLWSPIEESAPFGSDAGADAFAYFEEWRPEHTEDSPTILVSNILVEWGFELLDWNTLDSVLIQQEIDSGMIDNRLSQDNIVIAVAFAQFVLEGEVEKDIQKMAEVAIRRQVSEGWMGLWDEAYQKTRQEQLGSMLDILLVMND